MRRVTGNFDLSVRGGGTGIVYPVVHDLDRQADGVGRIAIVTLLNCAFSKFRG